MMWTSRLRATRRRIATMLGLLLSISIVGQQLPCLHAAFAMDSNAAVGGGNDVAIGTATSASVADEHAHHDMSMPSSGGSAPASDAPSTQPEPPHHDPAAPGCAQLMACGLAIGAAASNAVTMVDVPALSDAPVGPHLQYSTADLEVESPPPRS